MVNEYIEVQNFNQVQDIDSRRNTNNIISNQIETQVAGIESINNQLDEIVTAVNDAQFSTTDIDLTEVNDKLDNIDTTIITTQTQDILEIVNNQQEQINTIESKIDMILQKIDEM